MRAYTCECGKAQFFGSDTPRACQGCKICGTNYYKEPLEPHQFENQYNPKTGHQDRKVCKVCYSSEKIIMLSEAAIQARIDEKFAAKVTLDGIKALVVEATYFYHKTLTICVLELKNGFTVTGESACAHPANYDKEVGDSLAYNNALNKIWPLEGYLLRERLHTSGA